MCLHGELVRARAFCVYSTIWHGCEYLRCHDNLVLAFIKKVSSRDRTLIHCSNEERHDCSAIGGTMPRERFHKFVGKQLQVHIRL